MDGLACWLSLHPTRLLWRPGAISVTGIAGGTTYTSTVQVTVQALYEVQVSSHDSQNTVPPAPGEWWAYARVTAVDPRPQAERDGLTQRLSFAISGGNAAAIQRVTSSSVTAGKQCACSGTPRRPSNPASPTWSPR